jgi:Mn2+/Fe2+ NRAMP family transporter
MVMTGDKRMMGARANGWLTRMLGWATTAVTGIATAVLVILWVSGRG